MGAKLGHSVSEETKQKLRDAANKQFEDPDYREWLTLLNTGKKQSEETKEKRNAKLRGRPKSPETRARMVEAQRRRAAEYLPRTRNNGTYARWKKEVNERDGHTCQRCGKTKLLGRDEHTHHIKPWDDHPELRFQVSNGLTVCKKCHEILEPRRLPKGRKIGYKHSPETLAKLSAAAKLREERKRGA